MANERTNERTNDNSDIIYIRQPTRRGFIELKSGNVADLSYPTSKKRRGRVQGKLGNISPTITCGGNAIHKIDREIFMENQETKKRYRIRKLTPRECGRLMCVAENDIDKMLGAESNSQCYKAFGNSITVNVLCALFLQLGIQGKKRWNDMTLEEKKAVIYKGHYLENK